MTHDKIKIKNLEVFAKHGVFPEENILGQKFIISAVLHTDTRLAGQQDDITKSIHYGDACHMIKHFIEDHTFKLLETVIERLAEKLLLEIEGLIKVQLEIKKPWAPIGLPLETVSVEIEREWHMAFIGLGSNMGNKQQYLEMGINEINNIKSCRVVKVSDFIITPPFGGVEQDDFLNGAIAVKTLLRPEELLDYLHVIEKKAGRERKIRWGPRTLDLDILMYDRLITDSEKLHIPHKEMHKRDFVLKPLAQISPYLCHPVLKKTIQELLNDLQDIR